MQINQIVSQCVHILKITRQNSQYLYGKTRKKFFNSYILGCINYILPFIAGETKIYKDKVKKIIHTGARFVRGSFCFLESIRSIMSSVNLKMPTDIIDEASAKFFHKIIFNKEPKTIYNLVRMPRTRACAEPTLHYTARSAKMGRSAIQTGFHNYLRLPDQLKKLNQ